MPRSSVRLQKKEKVNYTAERVITLEPPPKKFKEDDDQPEILIIEDPTVQEIKNTTKSGDHVINTVATADK